MATACVQNHIDLLLDVIKDSTTIRQIRARQRSETEDVSPQKTRRCHKHTMTTQVDSSTEVSNVHKKKKNESIISLKELLLELLQWANAINQLINVSNQLAYNCESALDKISKEQESVSEQINKDLAVLAGLGDKSTYKQYKDALDALAADVKGIDVTVPTFKHDGGDTVSPQDESAISSWTSNVYAQQQTHYKTQIDQDQNVIDATQGNSENAMKQMTNTLPMINSFTQLFTNLASAMRG